MARLGGLGRILAGVMTGGREPPTGEEEYDTVDPVQAYFRGIGDDVGNIMMGYHPTNAARRYSAEADAYNRLGPQRLLEQKANEQALRTSEFKYGQMQDEARRATEAEQVADMQMARAEQAWAEQVAKDPTFRDRFPTPQLYMEALAAQAKERAQAKYGPAPSPTKRYGQPIQVRDGSWVQPDLVEGGTIPIEADLTKDKTMQLPSGRVVNVSQAGDVTTAISTEDEARSAAEADEIAASAEAWMEYPAMVDYIDEKLVDIDDLLENETGMSLVVGVESPLNLGTLAPGSPAADFVAKLNQVKAQGWLQALTDAKAAGATFGSLSDAENLQLTAAAQALDTAVSEEAFKKELREIKRLLRKSKRRKESRASKYKPTQDTPSRRRRFNPDTGQMEAI